MEISRQNLLSLLVRFNPWWQGKNIESLPSWHRSTFQNLYEWVINPPVARAVAISGPRQIGKTTLILQIIKKMIADGVSPSNILYVTMDHPIFKLAGIDNVISAWRELEPSSEGMEYLFIDEIQSVKDWSAWVKIQVDFEKKRRIVFTSSVMSMNEDSQESGVGRWHVCKLETLSFYEYLKIKNIDVDGLPTVRSLVELNHWSEKDWIGCALKFEPLIGQFNEYLLKGGFPQTALVSHVDYAQQLVREDIVDKVLKRDMTAYYGVRRILDLETTFLYLCMHDGGILDMVNLCKELGVKRPTAQSFIELLEAVHLVKRLPPFGYGKEVLRGRFKVYLADASLAPAILLKGKTLLENEKELGQAVETSVLKHLLGSVRSSGVSYWNNKKGEEVDFIMTFGNHHLPFEVKYREQHTRTENITGLLDFMTQKHLVQGYVVTKSLKDTGEILVNDQKVLKIPAMLLCYWLGAGLEVR